MVKDIIVDFLAVAFSVVCFVKLLAIHRRLGSKALGFFFFAVTWSASVRVVHLLEYVFPKLEIPFSLLSAFTWLFLILGVFGLEKDIDLVLDRLIEMRKKQKEGKA